MKKTINLKIEAGLRILQKPTPLLLSEWAEKYFYLSAGSSYVQGPWKAMPFQKSILDCLGNSDITSVGVMKSARIGYTKMLLAAIGYHASHKSRNQAIWQPTDSAAEQFSKSELDPFFSDVREMHKVFPHLGKQKRGNTLKQKVFLNSNLYVLGGNSPGNFRRISVDIAMIDELDALPLDTGEGSPVALAAKRIEGSTTPKLIVGSTPSLKNRSAIEAFLASCPLVFKYYFPCGNCCQFICLEFGGKEKDFGFKWENRSAKSVKYLCRCGNFFTQSEFLSRSEKGRWQSSDCFIGDNCSFYDFQNNVITTPKKIGFKVWSAYSALVGWDSIVEEFLCSFENPIAFKTFVNTTLGETWEEDEKFTLQPEAFFALRETVSDDFDLPKGVLYVTAAVDTQDDRLEILFDGWGVGEERWSVRYVKLFGDLTTLPIWNTLDIELMKSFVGFDGVLVDVKLATIDHGGHFSDEVNSFCRRNPLKYIPIKGSSNEGKPVANFSKKKSKHGVYLTEVGTDTAKDLLIQRLNIQTPGPGKCHFPQKSWCDLNFFNQLFSERRIAYYIGGVRKIRWEAQGRRNEVWDCFVYGLAAIRILQQNFGVVLTEIPTPAISKKRRNINKVFDL